MATGATIKARFNTLWDTYSAGQFSNAKLNIILEKAQVQYYYNLMKMYGLDAEVDEQATTYIKSFTATPTNNAIDYVSGLTSFLREIALKFKFVKNGITYYEYGKVLKDDAKGSPLKGNIRYPKYDFTNQYIRIYPENETCLEVSGLYFVDTFTIDVADAVTVLPFTDKNVYGIIEQALNVAAISTREQDYYQMSENEIKQNTNL